MTSKELLALRVQKLDEWKRIKDALQQDQKEVRETWEAQNEELVRQIKACLVGWEEEAKDQLVVALNLETALETDSIERFVNIDHYCYYGFDGSLYGGCRKWGALEDIIRDFEALQGELKDWFVITAEASRVYVTANRTKECVKVIISLVR